MTDRSRVLRYAEVERRLASLLHAVHAILSREAVPLVNEFIGEGEYGAACELIAVELAGGVDIPEAEARELLSIADLMHFDAPSLARLKRRLHRGDPRAH